ncbi:tyrosine-type recombinase/integrase [Salinigranum rubrum]|nr:site-specific integrase [Salinigranum rubrum]
MNGEQHTKATSRSGLEALTPEDAARLWVESRMDELAAATLKLQRFHVDQFTTWLEEENITDMRDVTARTVHSFRLQIKADIAQSTLAQRVSTVRRFLQFCASIDAINPSVPERVELPKRDPQAREEILETEAANEVLNYLRRFAYASREHALLSLTWHAGIRSGTLRGLDVDDVEMTKNRLRIRHRPDEGTPLKNGEYAERYIALSGEVVEILHDYIKQNRTKVNDEYGRKPLFTTKNGRAPVKTLRRWFQTATRPCAYGIECPHNRIPAECDAAQRSVDASDCPSSVSGHPVRRGAITHHLRKDVPEKVVSDRMNVSQDVLSEHYDRRSEDEKTEQRRQYLSNI